MSVRGPYRRHSLPFTIQICADIRSGQLGRREALKTHNLSANQRRTLKQMHIDLCALEFEGSYDRVAAFARQWKVDQLERVNSASK